MPEPLDPAIEGLRQAVVMAPADVELRRLLGRRLLAASLWDDAMVTNRELVRLVPDDVDAKIALASSFLGADRPTAAVLVVEDALRAAPERADLRYLYARALAAAGEGSLAVGAYREGYAMDPSLADMDLAVSVGFVAAAEGTAQGFGSDTIPGSPVEIPATFSAKPRITFADVGGMEALKEQIGLQIIHPFTNPDLYAAYGQAAGGGLLLYGPPGCGKTYLARATAGEIGASFVSVGIADILDMWIGSSERNLHQIFETARTHRPCVLFFDEADALASDRAKFAGSAGRTLVNQFLAELDGMNASNEDILVLAATNAPWHLDPAFRRPGRFDRVLFVPPPDQAARAAILGIFLEAKPTRNVDVERVASLTDGYSGADLKGLIDRAVQTKLAAAMRDGLPLPITTDDLLVAARSAPPSTREWFANVRNYVLYSNEGGLYDPVRPYLTG
jgi:transitional endoplasmic reticulum ATPase